VGVGEKETNRQRESARERGERRSESVYAGMVECVWVSERRISVNFERVRVRARERENLVT